jgi:hypothetical protein
MMVTLWGVVQGSARAVSYDDAVEEFGIVDKCIRDTLELSRVSKLARDQFNVLRAPGTCECKKSRFF